jgi:hypothetical protein
VPAQREWLQWPSRQVRQVRQVRRRVLQALSLVQMPGEAGAEAEQSRAAAALAMSWLQPPYSRKRRQMLKQDPRTALRSSQDLRSEREHLSRRFAWAP